MVTSAAKLMAHFVPSLKIVYWATLWRIPTRSCSGQLLWVLSGDAVKVLSRVSDLVPVGELHTDDHVSDVHEGKAVGDVQLIEQSRLARPQFQLNNGNDGRAHGQSPNSLVSDPTGIAADSKFDCRVFGGTSIERDKVQRERVVAHVGEVA